MIATANPELFASTEQLPFPATCMAALRAAERAAMADEVAFGWPELEAVIEQQFASWQATQAPKKGGGGRKRKKDLCFEEICTLCRMNWELITDDERGRVNDTLCQIRKVTPDLTVDMLRNFARRWAKQYPMATLTPKTFSANWSLVSHIKATKDAQAEEAERLQTALNGVRAEKATLYATDGPGARDDLTDAQLTRARWLLDEESRLGAQIGRLRGYG